MNELERTLTDDSAAAPPAQILEGVAPELAHRQIGGAQRTIYAELWHIVYWQQMTLEWIEGIETPYPEDPSLGFPNEMQIAQEGWPDLCQRFFATVEKAAAATRDAKKLDHVVRCPSPLGVPVRTMTVREQLESLAAHNAYHFGRIVLLRQINGAWPPA